MTAERADYPLAALVGQPAMVEALILLAVDPSLGGLLLVGEKGTAKSTAARALAEILPPLEAGDCPFHCRPQEPDRWCPECAAASGPAGVGRRPAPFRTVPLGVTEERLLGGLDWEKTLASGRPALKPGLLGEANNGLLYIDEVNLLDPSLAHLLLDAAVAGRVALERDGFSARHPARAALLGSMNPEEGPLGPQLADRFALTVNLAGETEPGRRSEIIRRRLEFERDSAAFRARWAASTAALKAAVERARGLLPRLRLTDQARGRAAALAAEARAAGHRADLALCLAARAAAAFAQAQAAESADDAGGGELCEVQPDWVDRMAAHVVPARRRPPPRPASRPIEAVVVRQAAEADRLAEAFSLSGQPEKPPEPRDESPDPDQALTLTIYETAESFEIVSPKTRAEIGSRLRAGRRGSRETAKARGRAFKTTARRLGRPLSLSATLRAAAPRQAERRLGEEERLILKPADLREKVYRQKTGRLVVFVVDSSGSIGTLYRMEEAKAAALALLADAYRKRDRVALVAFYGREAQLLLPPTNSPDLAARLLAALPSGGKTPLAAALALTHQLLRTERARDPKLTPYVVLMTDGRPNVPLEPQAAPWPEVLRLAGLMAADPSLKFLLIDTDRGAYNEYKLTRELAERLGCPRINLEELREGRLERWLETA